MEMVFHGVQGGRAQPLVAERTVLWKRRSRHGGTLGLHLTCRFRTGKAAYLWRRPGPEEPLVRRTSTRPTRTGGGALPQWVRGCFHRRNRHDLLGRRSTRRRRRAAKWARPDLNRSLQVPNLEVYQTSLRARWTADLAARHKVAPATWRLTAAPWVQTNPYACAPYQATARPPTTRTAALALC